jgi:hypothetical protein
MKTQSEPPVKPPRLTAGEKRIIAAFIERYPASAAAALDTAAGDAATAPGGGESPEAAAKSPRPQRLRPERIFPGLDRASPDERVSFLEAAEALEGRGLLTLVWARHRKGETLSALVCRDPELLYELAGKPSPKTTAEKVRAAAGAFARTAGAGSEEGALFSFLAETFTPLDAAGGIDETAVTDLVHLTQFLFNEDEVRLDRQGKVRGLTTRALSTALYGDSKRLENLTALLNPLLARARRQGTALPDFSFLDRSYPETYIAGKIALDLAEASAPAFNENEKLPPLVNAGGNILGLPLETILKLRRIRPLAGEAAVLLIENKETFFVLSETLPAYACFLYTGGHPNRAVRALVLLLAASGFRFSHAGDLDPEGILILQELAEIAGKPVRPLRMDADTFDQYLEYGRPLEASALKRTALISGETRTIPGMAELIRRIEETGVGVEQEIIDYRG